MNYSVISFVQAQLDFMVLKRISGSIINNQSECWEIVSKPIVVNIDGYFLLVAKLGNTSGRLNFIKTST